MNESITNQSISSVVSEPDYIGPNGTQRSPVKMFIGILIISIAICGIAMNLLTDSLTILAHVFWLIFHILYIGGLVYYFSKKWKKYREV